MKTSDATCCGDELPGATIVQGAGTPVCTPVEGGSPVCPIDACCNFFKPLKEGEAPSFVFSAGGPFELAAPLDCATCPPGGALQPLPATPTAPGAVPPGPLGGMVCLPAGSLPPGTYLVTGRVTAHGLGVGGEVAIRIFPDCGSVPCFTVAEDGRGCAPVAAGEDLASETEVIAGDLVFTVTDTCRVGFQILGNAGCPQGTVATITNVQIVFWRMSNRDLTNCGGNPLVTDCMAVP